MLGFKSLKTVYATLKGIEVMRAFYYGHALGEMHLVNRVFGL